MRPERVMIVRRQSRISGVDLEYAIVGEIVTVDLDSLHWAEIEFSDPDRPNTRELCVRVLDGSGMLPADCLGLGYTERTQQEQRH